VIEAVVFDLDGVLLDTEELWDEARRQIVEERGGRWRDDAQRAMMGMSSREWSRYMHDVLGVPDPPEEISARVVARLEALYRERLPLVPGALEAVRRIGEHWPLAIASSSNRPLIDLFLELTGTGDHFRAARAEMSATRSGVDQTDTLFRATVSSEEVDRGKPTPDVYLEAARRLGVEPASCAAIEDSENGLRSAAAAGMRVVAIPNRVFPPSDEALSLAHAVLGSLDELTPGVIEGL
jgi:beta-phosphoglucomutase-like phosphatase (HAD superfamily)